MVDTILVPCIIIMVKVEIWLEVAHFIANLCTMF